MKTNAPHRNDVTGPVTAMLRLYQVVKEGCQFAMLLLQLDEEKQYTKHLFCIKTLLFVILSLFFPFQEQKLKCNIRNPNSQFKPMTKLAIALKPGFRFSPWCAQPWLAPLCLHLVSQLSYLLASSPTTLQPQEPFSSLDTSNTPLLLNRCLWCAFCCEHSLPCWFLISWKNPSYMERLSLTTLDMVSSSFLTMAAFLFLSEHLPQFVNDLSSLPSASLIRLWALERRKSYVLLLTLSWCHWTRQMLMMTELNKWTMNKGIIADQ